jgi:uncharacterized repeat protein (TIGR01451 family)
MQFLNKHTRRVALAVVALGLGGLAPSAFAAGSDTNYNTDITNRANVNYSVSGVPQTVIQSSPAGNSTPGVGNGADTTFKVDKRIMFLTEETNATETVTGPGVTNVVTVFRVTNTTNGAQDFQLTPSNPASAPVIFTRTDNIYMTNLRARVSNAACATGGPMATPAYAGESATFINQLAEDSCKYVFILADTPVGAVNGDVATVLLTVKPSVAGTSGATVEAPTGAADVAGTVEAVYAESGPTTGTSTGNVDKDGVSFAYDQYVVGTLNVKKTAAVISDGFSPAGQAKAIPGAIVEYTITVQNNGLATTAATLTEVIPTNTTYVAGSTTLNSVAVSDVAGAMPYVSPGPINSTGQAAGVVIPGSTSAQQAIVKFRVTIN